MHLFRLMVLYTALGLGANMSFAGDANFDDLNALRDGDMKKMVLHSTPTEPAQIAFFDETGAEITLGDFKGKSILVNLWATWCAPCRKEMPSLAQLQSDKGGDTFEVVTIATMRNSQSAIDKFFADAQITNLAKNNDPKGILARGLGVVGLPMTLLIDAEGFEIGRLPGDADWASDDAYALIDAFIDAQNR
jgi:thiol-disulfide isomerase/thioredoxin